MKILMIAFLVLSALGAMLFLACVLCGRNRENQLRESELEDDNDVLGTLYRRHGFRMEMLTDKSKWHEAAFMMFYLGQKAFQKETQRMKSSCPYEKNSPNEAARFYERAADALGRLNPEFRDSLPPWNRPQEFYALLQTFQQAGRSPFSLN